MRSTANARERSTPLASVWALSGSGSAAWEPLETPMVLISALVTTRGAVLHTAPGKCVCTNNHEWSGLCLIHYML